MDEQIWPVLQPSIMCEVTIRNVGQLVGQAMCFLSSRSSCLTGQQGYRQWQILTELDCRELFCNLIEFASVRQLELISYCYVGLIVDLDYHATVAAYPKALLRIYLKSAPCIDIKKICSPVVLSMIFHVQRLHAICLLVCFGLFACKQTLLFLAVNVSACQTFLLFYKCDNHIYHSQLASFCA